jgi:hypothetical protein
MFSSFLHTILSAAPAYLVGIFTPAVSREVKSWFTKEATAAVTAVEKKL